MGVNQWEKISSSANKIMSGHIIKSKKISESRPELAE
jgi:hypothetical protein